MKDDKRTDDAVAASTEATQSALLNVVAGGDLDTLSSEARASAEKVARENAERMAAENAGTDAEQAAGGHIRAGEKFTGVDPVTGDAFAVTQGQKADLVTQGEAENERTLAQQKATARKVAKPAAPRA
jgi:hypothetical protein